MNNDTLSLNDRARAEIRAQLARQGRSQADLAVTLGWSRMYVSNRLGTKATVALSLPDLEAIAGYLGLPVDRLTRTGGDASPG